MTIAQAKAARRRIMNDKRWRPKKGNRVSKSVKRAVSLARKSPGRSVGYSKK